MTKFNFYTVLLIIGQLSSQTLTNDDATLSLGSNSVLYVQGDILNQKNGNFKNRGDVQLTGNFTNNAQNEAFLDGFAGTTRFVGQNQIIDGSSPSHFFNLLLEGENSIKELQQNIRITNHLELKDAELNVHNSIAHLSNPNPNSLTWNQGFISSDSIGGYLSRSTKGTDLYVFPVGSSNLFSVYRAVELQTQSADSSVFGVRLAAIDASLDNTGTSATGATGAYDRDKVDYKIHNVNPQFYHNIHQFSGTSPANYKIYYFQQEEPQDQNTYQLVGYWNKNKNQWEGDAATFASVNGQAKIGAPTKSASGLLNTSKDDPIALATKAFFIPEGFSPNGDGENDAFVIQGLKSSVGLSIYNRYGNLVYEASDYKNDFKGIANKGMVLGEQLPDGTYFYILKHSKSNEVQGYFTLNR